MKIAIVFVVLCCSTLAPAIAAVSAAPNPATAHADSLVGYWGPHPDRADSNTALPRPEPAPAWQTALLVPYYVVGVPLTMVDKGLKGVAYGLDRLGAFRATEQVVSGLRDPLGNYWLPDIGYGDAQGWRFGFTVKRPEFPLPGMITKGKVLLSTTDASLWTIGSLVPLAGPGRNWIEFGGGSMVLSRTDFYGTGYDTQESDRSFYRRDGDWFGAGWRADLDAGFEFVLLGHYSAVEAVPSSYDDGRGLDEVFGDDLPNGWGRTSSGFTGGLQFGFDDTTERGRPPSGARLLVFTQYYAPSDQTNTRFWTSGVSAEKFIELGYPQRTLALKGWFVREKGFSGNEVPFTRLISNRMPYQLRGYSTARFLATGNLGASAEYRWPIWVKNEPELTGLDAYVFGDAGQPFDRTSEIATDHLFWSLGAGLRVINVGADFVMRFEVAVGEEGTQVRLTTSQLFQFIKAGFYDGSDPVPLMR